MPTFSSLHAQVPNPQYSSQSTLQLNPNLRSQQAHSHNLGAQPPAVFSVPAIRKKTVSGIPFFLPAALPCIP